VPQPYDFLMFAVLLLSTMFGAAKGVVWCLVITFFAVTLWDSARGKILASWSGRRAALLIRRAVPLLPAELGELVGRHLDQFPANPAPEAPAKRPLPVEIDGRKSQPEP